MPSPQEEEKSPHQNTRQENAELLRALVGEGAIEKTLPIRMGKRVRESKVLFFKVDASVFRDNKDLLEFLLDNINFLIEYFIKYSSWYSHLTYDDVSLFISQALSGLQNREIFLAVNLDVLSVLGYVAVDAQREDFILGGKTVSGKKQEGAFVIPHAQGLGIAEQLIWMAEVHALEELMEDLVVLAPYNMDAVEFFLRVGYELVGETEVIVNVPGKEPKRFPFYVMVQTLAKLHAKHS